MPYKDQEKQKEQQKIYYQKNKKRIGEKTKHRILNALEDKKGIMIKICRSHKPNTYSLEIGDCKDMDMSSCRGATGFHNFYMEACLKEIKNEIEELA